MTVLRQIQIAVKNYNILLNNNQQNAKTYKEEYLADVEILIEVLNKYFEETLERYILWCNACVEVFEIRDCNIFLKLKKMILLKIVNHFLNKLSYNLAVVGNLQENLEKIKIRFIQYQYLN